MFGGRRYLVHLPRSFSVYSRHNQLSLALTLTELRWDFRILLNTVLGNRY